MGGGGGEISGAEWKRFSIRARPILIRSYPHNKILGIAFFFVHISRFRGMRERKRRGSTRFRYSRRIEIGRVWFPYAKEKKGMKGRKRKKKKRNVSDE